MEAGALLDRFRLEVRDTGFPQLWSDLEIYSYMDEAQKMFCRLTGGISDATSKAAQIPVTAGQGFAPISPLILKLRSVFDASGRNIPIANFEDYENEPSRMSALYSQVPGTVHTVVSGMVEGKLKLIAIPEATQTFSAIVYRLPFEVIESSGDEPEIAEHHHLSLLHWMKHLAYAKQDAEAYDRGKSEQFQVQFLQYCDMAKDEKSRLEHKYRSVSYSW